MVLNFDKKLVDMIYMLHTSNEFPWYYQAQTTNPDAEKNHLTFDTPQLTHVFYKDGKENSDFYKPVKELLDSRVEYKSIFRIKANMTTPFKNNHKSFYRPIHLDIPESGYKSLIYYINDSDGDTVFFYSDMVKRIEPKMGTGILFDSNMPHAGSNPINSKFRMVLNYIVEV